jgi:hypothetical protein
MGNQKRGTRHAQENEKTDVKLRYSFLAPKITNPYRVLKKPFVFRRSTVIFKSNILK